MHIKRSAASSEALLDPQHAAWQQAEAREFRMIPTPLKANPMIEAISPFLAQSTDHGTLDQLSAFGLHNGEVLTLRLRWAGGERQQIRDLDEFVDGVAVMFPLHAKASAVTMGGKGMPVNAWYWKANRADAAFDVVAEGYGTSVRRDGASSAVRSQGTYDDGHWHVTLQRPLQGDVPVAIVVGALRAHCAAGAIAAYRGAVALRHDVECGIGAIGLPVPGVYRHALAAHGHGAGLGVQREHHRHAVHELIEVADLLPLAAGPAQAQREHLAVVQAEGGELVQRAVVGALRQERRDCLDHGIRLQRRRDHAELARLGLLPGGVLRVEQRLGRRRAAFDVHGAGLPFRPGRFRTT